MPGPTSTRDLMPLSPSKSGIIGMRERSQNNRLTTQLGVSGGIYADMSSEGIEIHGNRQARFTAFGVSRKGTKVTIFPGFLVGNEGEWPIVKTTITLEGSLEYVYAQWSIDFPSDISIQHGVGEDGKRPIRTGNTDYWVIVTYEIKEGVYRLVRLDWPGGDMHLHSRLQQ